MELATLKAYLLYSRWLEAIKSFDCVINFNSFCLITLAPFGNLFGWQQTLESYQLYSRWVRAIEVYDRVIKIVSPKKAKLAEAETELARQMDKLNEKRTQLQQVTDKLQVSGHEFNGKIVNVCYGNMGCGCFKWGVQN